MPGTTPELNLSTALDADDNADYLTLNLANSLRTVDALFNNVTGHNHGAAHQGGPVTISAGQIPAGSIDNTKLAANSVDTSKIVDGTIATADLANNAVTNAKLGTDTARLNLLVNGGFEIWQRGNGPFSTAVLSADMWTVGPNGSDTISVSKDTTNVDAGSNVAAACTVTVGSGAGLTNLSQTIKRSDFTGIAGKTLTLSVRVRCATANAVRASIYDGAAWQHGTFHPGDGTYRTLTITATTGAAVTQVNASVTFAVSCTAYVDNAMLVVGSVPADYAPLHPADDLARCLRYYEAFSFGSNAYISTGQAYTATSAVGVYYWTVKKAISPTITFAPAPGSYALTSTNFGVIACTSAAPAGGQVYGTQWSAGVASGLVAGSATTWIAGTGQTVNIIAEANP